MTRGSGEGFEAPCRAAPGGGTPGSRCAPWPVGYGPDRFRLAPASDQAHHGRAHRGRAAIPADWWPPSPAREPPPGGPSYCRPSPPGSSITTAYRSEEANTRRAAAWSGYTPIEGASGWPAVPTQ